MHIVIHRWSREDDDTSANSVEVGRVTLTPDGLVPEGEGAIWMETYPQGLIAGDDDASYLRSLASCINRLSYYGAGVVEE